MDLALEWIFGSTLDMKYGHIRCVPFILRQIWTIWGKQRADMGVEQSHMKSMTKSP